MDNPRYGKKINQRDFWSPDQNCCNSFWTMFFLRCLQVLCEHHMGITESIQHLALSHRFDEAILEAFVWWFFPLKHASSTSSWPRVVFEKFPNPPSLHHCWIHHWKAIVEHHMKDTFPNGGKLMESIAKHWYVYIYIFIYVLYVYIYSFLYIIDHAKGRVLQNFLRSNFGPQDPKQCPVAPAFTSWAWMRIRFRRSLGIELGRFVVCGSPPFFWVVGPGRW